MNHLVPQRFEAWQNILIREVRRISIDAGVVPPGPLSFDDGLDTTILFTVYLRANMGVWRRIVFHLTDVQDDSEWEL